MNADPLRASEVRSTRVLVVEDDPSYREALGVALRNEGFDVELTASALEGLDCFSSRPPDIVLLDMVLPGMSGIEVCRRMQSISSVPVIMTSAFDTELDMVRGLELGASDFLTKPYRLRELTARIKAVLRRSSVDWILSDSPNAVGQGPTSDVVEAGAVRIDLARHFVSVNGSVVHFPRLEFDLLAALLTPPGRLRTREELIHSLWGGRDLADSRTLDTHIRRIRRKLEGKTTNSPHIVTIRGIGFRFDPNGSAEVPD